MLSTCNYIEGLKGQGDSIKKTTKVPPNMQDSQMGAWLVRRGRNNDGKRNSSEINAITVPQSKDSNSLPFDALQLKNIQK